MQSKNKLLIITDSWQPMVNGVVTTLEKCIKEANKDGWSVSVIHPGQFRNISCPGYPEVKIALPFGLSKKLDPLHGTHIHIATEGPLGIVARNWCVKNEVPFTTAYHTKWPEFLKTIYKIPHKLSIPFLRWFHRDSDCVLTTTNTMKAELEEMRIGRKVAGWTRGVDTNTFSDPRLTSVVRDKPKLVCVGRVSKEKNLDSFCRLPSEKYNLMVVGDGPYRAELQKKYPDVEFVGVKRGKELARCYRGADAMVFTSLHDTFGLVMIESMYMGTPVAAYPVTGPNDVIEEGVTGCMDDDLVTAIDKALALDRTIVSNVSRASWTWSKAWGMLRDQLV